MEYFKAALNQYADFSGRASRQEYWMFVLFYVIFSIVLSVVDGLLLPYPILSFVYFIGLLIPCLSAASRRLHDTGRSGWWQLLGLIPFFGVIALIVLLCLDSKDSGTTAAA